ncbi:MAG: VWA domain-containing protein [Blastocatellia bacterium]|nr:VWA domain-containing protein [Blastocatellia bacterium]
MRRTTWMLGIGLAILSMGGWAQSPQTKPQPPASTGGQDEVVRISTQLVQIDAVVTDRKGEHVDTLTEEDFELMIDGRKQALTFFRLIQAPAAAVLPARSGPAGGPAVTLAPENVRRTIAFVVDDLGLSFESTAYARQAIRKFVDEQMEEGDLVGIIRTGRGAGAFQQFTADRRVLYAAIEKLTWNPNSRDMIPRFGAASGPIDPGGQGGQGEDSLSSTAAERLEDFRETVFSVGTLGALNFVVRGLRELPGRKSAILISDGFRLFGQNRDNTQVLDNLRRLTDLANRSSVVIYSLDAKGLLTLGATAADASPAGMTGPQSAERLSRMSQQNFESQEGLSLLARETGGFAILNNNDLNLGIQKALKDQRSYYLLGFDPEDEKFDQKFHTIKLRLNRAGLQVRTRAGFIGRPDAAARPEPPRTRDAQVLAALYSPFGARDLPLSMTSFFFNSPNPKRATKADPESVSFVRSLFHIDVSKMTFKPAENGEKTLKLEIITFTFNENGAVIEQHGRAFAMNFDAKNYDLAMKKGLQYSDDFILKRPGAYQFRAVIRDPETQKLGSAGQFIQIPDLEKKRLALSGLVLAAPPETLTGILPGDIQPTPNVRRFSRTGLLDYGGVVYNPVSDPQTGKPRLRLQVEVYRDGKPVYQSEPRPLEPGEGLKPQRMNYGGRLKLTGFPPGDYLMHVIVEDGLAKKRYARAEQWMDFSVR